MRINSNTSVVLWHDGKLVGKVAPALCEFGALSFYMQLMEHALNIYAKRVTLEVIQQNKASFDELRAEFGLMQS